MSELLKQIDARTRLAGTNKLEILVFSIGLDVPHQRREVFGINVFKVREVMRTPEITRAPDMPAAVKGMVSLRGSLIPVIDLARFIGVQTKDERQIMIVSEYNGHIQGFLVASVDNILRLDWANMRVPPQALCSEMGGLVTAVSELNDGRLLMMLDVEKVLADISQPDLTEALTGVERVNCGERTLLFADDSPVARGQIARTLDAMGIRYVSTSNGKSAWQELQRIAHAAEASGRKTSELVHAVLTDVEMPETDGYMLTRSIKADKRFSGIPVIMHSSLSSAANEQLGRSVGVDHYVSKFEPQRLSKVIASVLAA
jgi:two-component system, chemotaxis family, chemotaxis protein CheV